MKYKTIQAMHEVRMMITTVVVPVVAGLMLVPEDDRKRALEKCKLKFNAGKEKIKSYFKKDEEA